MGQWVHRLSEVDMGTRTATCAACGPVTLVVTKRGRFCREGHRSRTSWSKVQQHKDDRCARCGLVPEHSCVLEVDHLDSDPGNNDPSNLQTLCANCHRVITYVERRRQK